MPLSTTIIHPALLGSLHGHFPSLCTILARDPTAEPSSYGEPDDTPEALDDHEDIPCSLHVTPKFTSREMRAPEDTSVHQFYTCYLQGYYPLIRPRMIAEVDGLQYNITAALSPSQHSHTQLDLELIEN